MIKLLAYELKKLIMNKIYLFLIILTIGYSYSTLTTHTILGIDYTAPFSIISYQDYLYKMSFILILVLIFFTSFYFSKKETKVQHLIFATKVNKRKYLGIKVLAIFISFIILEFIILSISFVFYIHLFQFNSFKIFIVPILINLILTLTFGISIGLLGGLFRRKISIS